MAVHVTSVHKKEIPVKTQNLVLRTLFKSIDHIKFYLAEFTSKPITGWFLF